MEDLPVLLEFACASWDDAIHGAAVSPVCCEFDSFGSPHAPGPQGASTPLEDEAGHFSALFALLPKVSEVHSRP